MLSFNFIPAKDFGTTKIIPEKTVKKWFFFKKIIPEKKIFTHSRGVIMIEKNDRCPTVMAHPSELSNLIKRFIALPRELNAEISYVEGKPVSYKLL